MESHKFKDSCYFQVGLVILLLLTIVTLGLGAQTSLPQLSYMKAIDIWMFACLFNVCATLGVIGVGEKSFIIYAFIFVMDYGLGLLSHPSLQMNYQWLRKIAKKLWPVKWIRR